MTERTGLDATALMAPRGLRLLAPWMAALAVAGAAGFDAGATWQNVLAGTGAVPFFVWAWKPATGTLPLTVITAAIVVAVTGDGRLEPAMFLLSLAATAVGSFESSSARFVTSSVIVVAAPAVADLLFETDAYTGIWVGGIVLPLALTRMTRHQTVLSLELADARAELADQQVLEERRRIARDVHDSVGHGLAAMLLHITGARHVIRRDLGAADEALAEAEEIGKRSMIELRQTLGLLRTDLPGSPSPPVPDPTRLVDLGVEVVGDLDRLDAMVGLSLHRVAEEALANARRHAPGSVTAARLDVGDNRAVLTIESTGAARPRGDGDRDRPRYGIVGMSERIAAVGGALDVGPTDDGWLVRASVPLRAPS